jgi:DNA-binding MarR family transcriptional regulator
LKEIAENTQVSPPSASSMVEKLVELGAITREPGKTDRREVRVSISARGLKAVESLEKGMLTSLTDILEGIGPESAQLWCGVYEKISEFITAADASDSVSTRKSSS